MTISFFEAPPLKDAPLTHASCRTLPPLRECTRDIMFSKAERLSSFTNILKTLRTELQSEFPLNLWECLEGWKPISDEYIFDFHDRNSGYMRDFFRSWKPIRLCHISFCITSLLEQERANFDDEKCSSSFNTNWHRLFCSYLYGGCSFKNSSYTLWGEYCFSTAIKKFLVSKDQARIFHQNIFINVRNGNRAKW